MTLSTVKQEDAITNPSQAPSQVQLPDEAHAEASGGFSGLPTGFPSLDSKLKGLNPAEVIVLASRPAVGKTTLALKIAKCVALGRDINGCPMKGDHNRQHAVAVFSLECCLADLATRMHCGISSVATTPGKAPVIVDDTGSLDIMDLCARAHCMQMRHKVELIIIDYLQLCNCREFARQGRRTEWIQIAKQIKAMARELHIPVIVATQLCRGCEMRGDSSRITSPPALCEACNIIVQEADAVLVLRRPDRASGIAERNNDGIIVDVTKNSNGPTGEVRLDFDGVSSAPFVETSTLRGEVSSEIVLIDFNNDKEHVANPSSSVLHFPCA